MHVNKVGCSLDVFLLYINKSMCDDVNGRTGNLYYIAVQKLSAHAYIHESITLNFLANF